MPLCVLVCMCVDLEGTWGKKWSGPVKEPIMGCMVKAHMGVPKWGPVDDGPGCLDR